MEAGDARLAPWEERLHSLEELDDPIDRLLAEVESRMAEGGGLPLDPSQLELFGGRSSEGEPTHRMRTPDGHVYRGSWSAIVRQMRDAAGFGHESLSAFMRRMAERWHEQSGVDVPFRDPEVFLRAAAEYRLMFLEDGPD